MASILLLPPEIFIIVAGYLISPTKPDRALRSFSTTFPRIYGICRPLLFKSLHLNTPRARKLLLLLLQKQSQDEDLIPTFVQEITIDWHIYHKREWNSHGTNYNYIRGKETPWTNQEYEQIMDIVQPGYNPLIFLEDKFKSDLLMGDDLGALIRVLLYLLPELRHINIGSFPDDDVVDTHLARFLIRECQRKATSEKVPGLKNLTKITRIQKPEDGHWSISQIYPYLRISSSLATLELELAQDDSSFYPAEFLRTGARWLPLKHIVLKKCHMGTQFLVNLIASCRTLESFEYSFCSSKYAEPTNIDCRQLGQALKLHKDTLEKLELTYNVSTDLAEIELIPVDPLIEFAVIKSLKISTDLLTAETCTRMIDVLPSRLQRLEVVNSKTTLVLDEKIREIEFSKGVTDTAQSDFIPLKDLSLRSTSDKIEMYADAAPSILQGYYVQHS